MKMEILVPKTLGACVGEVRARELRRSEVSWETDHIRFLLARSPNTQQIADMLLKQDLSHGLFFQEMRPAEPADERSMVWSGVRRESGQ